MTPLHRSEVVSDSSAAHLPPGLPAGVDHTEVLDQSSGHGPLFHRRYATRIADPALDAAGLISLIAQAPNRATPTAFARFHKVLGDEGDLTVGDEYVVRMPGPWDGPVRVIDRQPGSFRLATLEGHLEAGQIEFRALAGDDGELRFEIESWARSSTRLAHVLYHRLRMAKEVQAHMWISFLEHAAELARGRMRAGVTIETTRVETDGR